MSAVIAVLLLASVVGAFEVPNYSGPVNDQAGVLSDGDRERLIQKILNYRNSSSNEIGVLIVRSLGDNALENVAYDVFKKWGIGKAAKDNGVLFLVAVEDRKARVEVGYGLEGELTDIEAGRLVSRKSPMADHFRKNDYAGGAEAVIDGIVIAIGGEYKPAGTDDKGGKARRGFPILGALFLGMMVLSAVARRRRSLKGGGFGGWWMGGMGGLGGLGGGSGGGGGGGGFSFGGGSSGGGGASGGW